MLHFAIPRIYHFPFLGNLTEGFPSLADDHLDESIDLNSKISKDRDANFFKKIESNFMTMAGIEHGDLLVINRGLVSRDGKIAVCIINGEFTIKRISVSHLHKSLIFYLLFFEEVYTVNNN